MGSDLASSGVTVADSPNKTTPESAREGATAGPLDASESDGDDRAEPAVDSLRGVEAAEWKADPFEAPERAGEAGAVVAFDDAGDPGTLTGALGVSARSSNRGIRSGMSTLRGEATQAVPLR